MGHQRRQRLPYSQLAYHQSRCLDVVVSCTGKVLGTFTVYTSAGGDTGTGDLCRSMSRQLT